MYKRVLVTLDGSPLAEQSLPYARLLSKGLGVPLVLFRAYNPMPDMVYPPSGSSWDRIVKMMRDEAHEYIAKLASKLKAEGVAVDIAVKTGNPADEIINEAEWEPTTLIVMSTHGRSGIARGILGSVATRVVSSSTSPVFLVKSKRPVSAAQDIALDHVIVALDGSDLAEEALPHVTGLAAPLKLKVTLVTVNEHPRVPVDVIGRTMSPNEKLFQEYNARAKTYLEKVAATLAKQGMTGVEQQVLHGLAADVIVDRVNESKNSFIALTTHGRSGLGRWILGSVADRVARESNVPVLIARVKR